jgi:hypothetical protein
MRRFAPSAFSAITGCERQSVDVAFGYQPAHPNPATAPKRALRLPGSTG